MCPPVIRFQGCAQKGFCNVGGGGGGGGGGEGGSIK